MGLWPIPRFSKINTEIPLKWLKLHGSIYLRDAIHISE